MPQSDDLLARDYIIIAIIFLDLLNWRIQMRETVKLETSSGIELTNRKTSKNLVELLDIHFHAAGMQNEVISNKNIGHGADRMQN